MDCQNEHLLDGKAVEQFAAIHDHAAKISPQYSSRLIDRITQRSKQIATFPASGRLLAEMPRIEQIREVIENSYRIIYYIGEERIDILAVIHGMQQLTLTDK